MHYYFLGSQWQLPISAPFEDDVKAGGLDLDGSGKLYRENLLSIIKRGLELDALGRQAKTLNNARGSICDLLWRDPPPISIIYNIKP